MMYDGVPMRGRLKEMLIRHEGIRYIPYQDTEGHWTIGVGHKISNGLSRQVVMMILDEDVEWVMDACQGLYYWDRLNEPRQVVIASMIFNLGVAGFRRFRRLNAALEHGRWSDAADEMMDSRWATQVKGRALELAEIMRVGEFRGVEI